MTDQEIIHLFRQGQREKAFTKLYGEWPKARRLVLKMGANNADANDLFQDALVILYKKLLTDQFVLSGSLNGFIYHTVRILCLEKLRKEQRTVRYAGDVSANTESYELSEADNRQELAQKALEKLAEKCREILRLFYWEKRSMEFIAKQLSLKTEQAAKTQKYKCLEAARNEFKTLAGKEAAL